MTLNLQTPFPTFGGSTGGGYAAEVEENMLLLGLALRSRYLKCLLAAQQ
jgi:hypothetical protein